MRVGLLQLRSSDNPAANLVRTVDLIGDASLQGATFVLTPEVTNCVSFDRKHQADILCDEAADPTLAGLREAAKTRGIWLLIGSLALKSGDSDGRFVNRSFLIGPDGGIRARYDKIHMFDVTVSETETYRESSGYRAGEAAVVADTGFARIGMTICYDVRFPYLYRHLAQEGASILTVPSAFSPVTGAAHWETLLRARAIETGSFVLAPAQSGTHDVTSGRARKTWGHSLVVGPWGDVHLDAGTDEGAYVVEIDLKDVVRARRRISSLSQGVDLRG